MIAHPLLVPIAGAALLLAGCSVRTHDDGKDSSASITIGNGGGDGASDTRSVSISAPGFSAKMDMPNLDLGSGSMQIEDMKVYPGTKIEGVQITGKPGSGADGDGNVEMGFTTPAGVGEVIAWYRDQAQKTGWTIVQPTPGHQFEATKQAGHGPARFALQIAANETGSGGRFTVTGR